MAEIPANEDEAELALGLDRFQEGLNHHRMRHVRHGAAAAKPVLAVRPGADLALEDEIIGAERFKRGSRRGGIDRIEPDGRDDARAFCLKLSQIGLVDVPANKCDRVEQARCGFDPLQCGQEFGLPVPVIPGRADDGGGVAAPIGIRIVPGDILDGMPLCRESGAQGVHHVVVFKSVVTAVRCAGKGDLRGNISDFHGAGFSTSAGCVQNPRLAIPVFRLEIRMSDIRFDVVGLGNAIVDVLSRADDAFLAEWGIHKNAMNLIEEPRAHELTRVAKDPLFTSGGSGANTIAGLASFGATAAYIGKVADDELGAQFKREMEASGVPFATQPLSEGPATARSIIFVTDDGHRSMNTFLGASVLFSKDDVDVDVVRAGGILYLEGYLFDKDEAKEAFIHAAETAKAAGRKVSLTLSDKFCVDRHRASFLQLIRNNIDILFANEEELLALYQTDDFDAAITSLQADTAVAAVTRSEKGSVVLGDGEPVVVEAVPVKEVVDTTGAGDQYAAGFLFGLSRGLPLVTCARLGHIAAAEVICHIGPRPAVSYKVLAEAAGIFA